MFYVLAAVMLTVSCYYFIINIRRDIREIIKPAIAANRYTNMVAEDYRLRTILFVVPGMMSNIIFAVFNGVVAVTSRSAWLGTLAAYYILLSLMRSGVVTQERRLSRIRDEKERMRKELRVYRRNSVMFLFLAVVLVMIGTYCLFTPGLCHLCGGRLYFLQDHHVHHSGPEGGKKEVACSHHNQKNRRY